MFDNHPVALQVRDLYDMGHILSFSQFSDKMKGVVGASDEANEGDGEGTDTSAQDKVRIPPSPLPPHSTSCPPLFPPFLPCQSPLPLSFSPNSRHSQSPSHRWCESTVKHLCP